MTVYKVKLETEIPVNFMTQLAANSCDIDINKKSTHELEIDADLTTPFNIGLIVGSSGSGKSTLAKHIFGNDCFKNYLNLSKPPVNLFPEKMSYDEIVDHLTACGLTSVPTWIRPAFCLSTGELARLQIALGCAFSNDGEIYLVDEFTSTVSREIGKILSHAIQKYIRLKNKKIILVSCHQDVIQWLNPDFIINTNESSYTCRRSLWRSFKREERFKFDIRKVQRRHWPRFEKYHYLTKTIPSGLSFYFGLFLEDDFIGYISFTNYVPHRKHSTLILHGSRLVIRPEFTGLGLGGKFNNAVVEILSSTIKANFRVSTSHVPMARAMIKDPHWKFISSDLVLGKSDSEKMRKYKIDKKTFSRLNKPTSFRKNVKIFKFHWIG